MQVRHVVTAAAIVLALAGCQRTTADGFGASGSSLAPLEAQPVGGVQSGALPPPSSPMGQGGQFPTAPQQVAAAPAMTQPAGALDVRKEGMLGNWRVSNGGASCDMFLTLTNLGSGSRGGTRGCAGPLTTMRSWEVSGKQVVLKDLSGNQIGSLYKTSDARYDGSLATGGAISLSR